ncbi:MAG: arylsulfatase [Verrucomicrobiota bacterium]
MKLFRFACLVLSRLAVGIAAGAAGFSAETARPNIVFILADDLGYGDLGCYGQKQLATPHIDALAKRGMRFTNYYAGNASCAPSRSSLMTGLHTGHVRHRDNRRFVYSYGFSPDDVTFAEVLRGAGYATAISGKWHLGDRADSQDIPHHHGFDYAYCIGHPYPDRGWEHWPSHVFVNGVQTPIPENGGGRQGRYMDDLYTDAALGFIREKRAGPFVVLLSLQGVHAPMDGVVSKTYAERDWPEPEKVFASMLERVDESVGRVVATLRELGLEEKTVVFFSSDNGPHNEGGHKHDFFASNGPWRGHKFQFYEGGLRVPLIAAWPGTIAAGATSEHVSAMWDMLPTFAELGEVKEATAVDGISLVPTLRGRGAQRTHTYLYWESQDAKGSQALRWKNWKAVKRGVSGGSGTAKLELYDLATDLGEKRDVAAAEPDVVRQIEALLREAHVASTITPLLPGEAATEFIQSN